MDKEGHAVQPQAPTDANGQWLFDLAGVQGVISFVMDTAPVEIAWLILSENPAQLQPLLTDKINRPYQIVPPSWAQINPISVPCQQILQSGYRIVYDPEGILSALAYHHGKTAGHLLAPRREIPLDLVQNLLTEQFPLWQDLPLRPVETAGWCNGAFRLGQDLLIKIPRAQRYAHSHPIEQVWLPHLQAYLSVQVPKPVALGQSQTNYPWHWSLYRWIEGKTASTLSPEHKLDLARDLAHFLKQLWSAPTQGGPAFFEQMFFRGAPLIVYDHETQTALAQLGTQIDGQASAETWQAALASRWQQPPVWVHGDLFPANLLVRQQQLQAVIDFGNLCLGDPACDLAMTWTFFEGESRACFQASLDLDAQTWQRARGWVLWKALITLAGLSDQTSEAARENKDLIALINQEHQNQRP